MDDDPPARPASWLLTAVRVFACATALALLHYVLLRPNAGTAFGPSAIAEQEHIAHISLTRPAPVVFGVALVVAGAVAAWLRRSGRGGWWWALAGALAGAVGYAAAAPFVPEPGPFAAPDLARKTAVTLEDLFGFGLIGAVLGAIVGAIVGGGNRRRRW